MLSARCERGRVGVGRGSRVRAFAGSKGEVVDIEWHEILSQRFLSSLHGCGSRSSFRKLVSDEALQQTCSIGRTSSFTSSREKSQSAITQPKKSGSNRGPRRTRRSVRGTGKQDESFRVAFHVRAFIRLD